MRNVFPKFITSVSTVSGVSTHPMCVRLWHLTPQSLNQVLNTHTHLHCMTLCCNQWLKWYKGNDYIYGFLLLSFPWRVSVMSWGVTCRKTRFISFFGRVKSQIITNSFISMFFLFCFVFGWSYIHLLMKGAHSRWLVRAMINQSVHSFVVAAALLRHCNTCLGENCL